MNVFIHTIFPEIFTSFLNTSIIKKASERWLLNIHLVNIRDFCLDKQKQVDDKIYGWWSWMLIKAKPVIDSIEHTIKANKLTNFKIFYLAPSKNILDQQKAFSYSKLENVILLCWRYEWIDYRVEEYFKDKYWNFERLSIGKYVLMWGEVAAMVFIEVVWRLVPGVIKEESLENESYNPSKNMENIEYPQYTVPQEVYGYKVPDVLLSGNHKKIKERREKNELNF